VQRSGVRRGDEDDSFYGVEKRDRFRAVGAPAIGGADRLLHHQTAETVTDENERAAPRRRLGQPILKDMAGLGRDFPIGCLHKLVADCVA
jgi:hypothetical protein